MIEVVEYKVIDVNDFHDDSIDNWSRKYEYPIILRKMQNLIKNDTKARIHNTACGGMYDVHRMFVYNLAARFPLCTIQNSDIHQSEKIEEWFGLNPKHIGYKVYDVCTKWRSEQFDYVICVSTLEHLKSDLIGKAMENLIRQLKHGGRLFVTFDSPPINLLTMNSIVGTRLSMAKNPIEKMYDGVNTRIIFLEAVKV